MTTKVLCVTLDRQPWTRTVLRDPEGNEFCVGEMLSERTG